VILPPAKLEEKETIREMVNHSNGKIADFKFSSELQGQRSGDSTLKVPKDASGRGMLNVSVSNKSLKLSNQ
jgi:hypothetical protein